MGSMRRSRGRGFFLARFYKTIFFLQWKPTVCDKFAAVVVVVDVVIAEAVVVELRSLEELVVVMELEVLVF